MTYRLSWSAIFGLPVPISAIFFIYFSSCSVGVYLEKEVPGVYPSGALNIFLFFHNSVCSFFIHKLVAAVFL